MLKGFDFTDEHNIKILSLMLKAEEIWISAFHMVKQRARIEALALFRIALEAEATALHIAKDAEAMAIYLAGDYKSTSSISFSKKHIPIVGELWGALSKTAVHTNAISFGPKRSFVGPDNIKRVLSVDYVVRRGDTHFDILLLNMVSLVSLIGHRVFELAFCKRALDKEFDCLAIPSINLFIAGKKTDELIEEYFDKITSLADSL